MSAVQMPAPPSAPKKKRRWPLVLGGIAIAIVGIASLPIELNQVPEAPAVSVAPVEPVDVPAVEIVSATEFVDFAFTSKEQRDFCNAYFGLGNDDIAFRAFEEGAGPDVDGMPTNRSVFDELVWRCIS